MASWAIIQNSSQILLIQRSRKTTRADQWCFPGGGIKANETPKQACIREVFEETQLVIRVVKTAAKIGDDYYFLCKLEDPLQSVILKQNECRNYVWINPRNLTNVGIIMNLKVIVPLLRFLGYKINLSDDLERYIA
ncbi:NUDIX hydrolase [Acaryochloris sp. IP29b_bin.148]|uniref:NUDIX hydrolase n=1 Tax=Acaryochloris sp. IP29b_bin.148 TaxID=2969218 RepID=UPI0034554E50